MTLARHAGPTPLRVAQARAAEEAHLTTVRHQAVRTVASNSMDVQDCRVLLAMLGLDVVPNDQREDPFPG